MDRKFSIALLVVVLVTLLGHNEAKSRHDMFNGAPKSEGGETSGDAADKSTNGSGAGDEDTDEDEEDESWFDSVDPATLGKKDCTNNEEVDHCVDLCEADKDCALTAQESQCESDCLVMCKYIEKERDKKCLNHMVVHITWYRDFGSGNGKTKVNQAARGKNKPQGGDGKSEKKPSAKPSPQKPPSTGGGGLLG